MTSTTKNRILAAVVAVAIIGVAALILIAQPASVKAEAAKPSATSPVTAAAPNAATIPPSAAPNISAANPGQEAVNTTGAVAPDQAPTSDLPKASRVTEPYKQDAEKAGNEFLKIYFNSPGSTMETPSSYVDKLVPYVTSGFLDQLRGPAGSAATVWTPFGKTLHDKKLDYAVDPACSLAAGQGFAPAFDETNGGNLPCTFKQTIVGHDGKTYAGNDLHVEITSNGTQSLKMVKENGAWKVAAIDSYGQ